MENWILVSPFSTGMLNAVYMGEMSRWRKAHPVKGYNDFTQATWDYQRRIKP